MYEYNLVLKFLDDCIKLANDTANNYKNDEIKERALFSVFVLEFFREALKKEIDKQMAIMGEEMEKQGRVSE